MTRRDLAFVLAAIGAGAQFFGAMVGQGMLGDGLLFGLAGPSTGNLAAVLGLVAAATCLVLAVRLMFVADLRTAGLLLIVAVVIGSLAAGPIYLATAIPTLMGGLLAWRTGVRTTRAGSSPARPEDPIHAASKRADES